MKHMATEGEVRKRYGIPDTARQVLILGESSHWDPDWLFTSQEYYRFWVKRIIDRVLEELTKESRRVFSLEAVFFLKLYWDREPEKRDTIKNLVHTGQLRFIGTGYTSPDATLPETEAIFRDYLYGRKWLRDNGMEVEPEIAYLPDDFGCSPALPSILQALGLKYVSLSRIDGQLFPGSDYRGPKGYPLPGSNAELLLKKLKSIDFIWQSTDGSHVLCHLNPHGYGQGDSLTFKGLARWMGMTAGVPSRSEGFVAKRIHQFVTQLSPVSRTPYLFCPIGLDFNSPIKDLLDLVDRYNKGHYPKTGVYVINASLEEYCFLVSCHAQELPWLAVDPNPYFMGFYTSRGDLKRQCVEAVQRVVSIESRLVSSRDARSAQLDEKIRSLWEKIVVTNHHDFITGTATNRVYRKEQVLWMDGIWTDISRLSVEIVPSGNSSATCEHAHDRSTRAPQWELQNGRLKIETRVYSMVIDERSGGCITELKGKRGDEYLLSGLGNDLVVHRDTGGLWRMGHEFRGGTFKEVQRASRLPASLSVVERGGRLEVTATSLLDGKAALRRIWIENDSDTISMRIEGRAGDYRTITCLFETPLHPQKVTMDVPGGIAQRPLNKLYDPTFWPAKSFAHVKDMHSEKGCALYANRPFAVSAHERGALQFVCLRNAPLEKAWGVLPLLSFPAYGREAGLQCVDYAITFTDRGGWLENRVHLQAHQALRTSWNKDPAWPGKIPVSSSVATDHEDVVVMALKHADVGDGVIARLYRYDESIANTKLRLRDGELRRAFLCTAMEEDIQELEIRDGAAVVPIRSNFATVRIFCDGDP